MSLELTNENYYSTEADREYMSVSQYKDFCGTWGIKGCQFMAMERLNGNYPEKKGLPLLVGGYVDAYFEGTLEKYKAEHPEIIKKDGSLKADFLRELLSLVERRAADAEAGSPADPFDREKFHVAPHRPLRPV